MKVCCVFSLESPRRGDSNEYTQYTIFNMNKKNTINYPKSAATGFFSKGIKNEFETAVVNEPSVFEPLKFYCILVNPLLDKYTSMPTQKLFLHHLTLQISRNLDNSCALI